MANAERLPQPQPEAHEEVETTVLNVKETIKNLKDDLHALAAEARARNVEPNDLREWKRNFLPAVRDMERIIVSFEKAQTEAERSEIISKLDRKFEILRGPIADKVIREADELKAKREGESPTSAPEVVLPAAEPVPEPVATLEPVPPQPVTEPAPRPEPVPEPRPEPAAELWLPAEPPLELTPDMEVASDQSPIDRMKELTPAEQTRTLSGAIEGLQKMTKPERREAFARKFMEERGLTKEWEELRLLQQQEFEATKKFYTENGRLGRWYAKSTGIGREELNDAKMRAEEAAFKLSEAIERATAFSGDPDKAGAERIGQARGRAFLIREIAMRPKQLETFARIQGMNERGKDVVDHAISANNWINKKLESLVGPKWTRAIRITSTAFIAGVGAASIGSVAVTGVLGYTGWRATRGLIAAGYGGVVGKGMGEADSRIFGKEAAEELRTQKRTGITSSKNVRELKQSYAKGSKEALERRRKLVETVAAAIAGAELSNGLGAYFAQVDGVTAIHNSLNVIDGHTQGGGGISHADTSVGTNEGTATGTGGTSSGVIENSTPNGTGTSSGAIENATPNGGPAVAPVPSIEDTAQSSAPASIPNADQLSVHIDKPGEGAFQLWKDMQQKLADQGYSLDGDTPPPAVIHHILESTPRELANEYQFHHEAGAGSSAEGGVMHSDDTLSISEDGKIVFTPHGGDSVTLAHTDGTELKPGEGFAGPYRADIDHARIVETHTSTAQVDRSTDNVADDYNGTKASYPNESSTPPERAPHGVSPAELQHEHTPPARSGPPSRFVGRSLEDEYAGIDSDPVSTTPPASPIDSGSGGSAQDMHVGRSLEDDYSQNEAAATVSGFDPSQIDAATRHVYESPQGQYMFGGGGDADADALKYAIENKVTIFVNHSQDKLLGRVHDVTEFRGADAVDGKITPIHHTGADGAKYDIDTSSFTKMNK